MKVHHVDQKTRVIETVDRAIGPVLVELAADEANSLTLILDSFLDAMAQGGTHAYQREVTLARALYEKLSKVNNVVSIK